MDGVTNLKTFTNSHFKLLENKTMIKTKKKRSPRLLVKERVQKLANKYARLRDCGDEGGTFCISCRQWKEYEELDGGHFIPTTSQAIRFDERNINAQCIKCNRFLHGNPRHYAKGMVAKYGQAVVEELEAQEHRSKKWTLAELLELEIYYKEKIALIKRY